MITVMSERVQFILEAKCSWQYGWQTQRMHKAGMLKAGVLVTQCVEYINNVLYN